MQLGVKAQARYFNSFNVVYRAVLVIPAVFATLLMPDSVKKGTYASSRASVRHTGSTVDDNGLHIPPPTQVGQGKPMPSPPPRWPHLTSPLSMSAGERTPYQNMTITDDHSEGSDIKRRKLMAVAGAENAVEKPGFRAQRAASGHDTPDRTFPPASDHIPEYNPFDDIPDESQNVLEGFQPYLFKSGFQRSPYATFDPKAALSYRRLPSYIKPTKSSYLRSKSKHSFSSQAAHSPAAGITSVSGAIDDPARAGHHTDPTDVVDEVQKLRDRVAELESQLQESIEAKRTWKPPRLQVLYRLQADRSGMSSTDNMPFEDEPEITKDKGDTAHLRCRNQVSNLELYLLRNPDISFVVYRTYPKTILLDSKKAQSCSQPVDQVHLPPPLAESIFPVEKKLKQALGMVLERKREFRQILDEYLHTGELIAPYLFIYHSRNDLEDIRSLLPLDVLMQLELLLGYVEYAFGHEYREADEMLKKDNIAPAYIRYMAKPGDVLIVREGKYHTGFIAESWLSSMKEKNPSISTASGRKTIIDSAHPREGFGCEFGVAGELIDEPAFLNHPSDSRTRQSSLLYTWTLTGKTLEFDGCFYWKEKLLIIEMSADSLHQASAIADLNIFPLRHAPKELSDLLQRRGSMFWKCRTKNLISYQPDDDDEFSRMTDDRYMIDMLTFRTLHPHNAISVGRTSDDLSLDVIRDDDRFQYLLPPLIKGYNLRRKAWHDLAVDRIFDVQWNREAFHSLAIEKTAKSLIEALIISQLEEEKSTDLISGKGNGLILLFHGGPGTGKTLTAEGVAEIANKPLYRVTCGDVGTKAEEVEKYLDSVLHLGRIWDCVVLLDEADVFLEQRSLEDLERNALVSVFLRMLEYYEGILILTSNRVGTLDEAFISRIQLALHYPDLGPRQRHQIWQTFIDRLENLDEDIDFANLRENLHVLKQEKLNGRQIRNVITTARQYAKWEKTTLTFEHLKDVIEISGRFGTYLHDLRGFSENELAKDGGIR
ncbi:ATPase, AAA-type, core [Aspergillus terreus]|uniref:ATPase, AAA-type, core n=1 Tax=Aspergillus terreus TaxID=33178 RepID=A0A5M3ZHY5_ASPTE|nr:hypothetical protein ATETN484_0017012500 [Aspergillus terreus]GFF21796.1 ATPase, AAA-type, core [Aspergillus terreus]